MRTLAIIPARYASTRFPGKPLALISGKPMISVVAENIVSTNLFDMVVVATDDERIAKAVENVCSAIFTSEHNSGTDRCAEALSKIQEDFDVVVNVQGDEPFVPVEALEDLLELFDNSTTDIATLVTQIKTTEELFDPNIVKVVSGNNSALYFSRNPIPYNRDIQNDDWFSTTEYWKHIGIYAFRAEILKEIVKLPQSSLEKAEKLEQLRWLENGYRIKVAKTDYNSISVDTPEDLKKANEFYLQFEKKGS